MVVAVTNSLKHLAKDIEGLGYTVVVLGQYDYPIDAMIYTEYIPEISYVSSNNISKENYGILMINAKNKTIKEIDTILKTKLYSPLF